MFLMHASHASYIISYYSHANASNQVGSRSKITALRSLVFDDVNRLLWHGHTVAIAAPSDGPPTSLGVGAGIAGANPNRTPLSLVSFSVRHSSSLRFFPFYDPCSTTRSFLPGVSSSERITDRPPEIRQVLFSRTYFAPPIKTGFR